MNTDFIQQAISELYGEEFASEYYTPQLCVFVREDGRYCYSRVKAPAEVTSEEYEGEIYMVKRMELVAADFLDGRKNIHTTVKELLSLGVCPEEIKAVLNDLTERTRSDGTPRRDNTSSVAYKVPVKREYNGRKVFAFLVK